MPKATAICNSIVNLMYRATAWANVADNAASSPLTSVHVSLHTGNLTAGTGTQTDNETSYTNYARQAVARSTGWAAASGGATQNAATISFPQCGVTGATVTHVATGTLLSGAGASWHYGALNSSLAVAIGYPELVSIANTTLNQTGRAIEALSIVMLVYLTLSLLTSALMNWFNASAAIQER